jgi:hypothetical protein
LAHPVERLKNERGDLLLHLRDGLDHFIDAVCVAPLLDGLLSQFLQLYADLLKLRIRLDRRLHLLLLALRGLLRVHAFAMRRSRLVFVINGFGIERIADAGERLADLGLLFGRLPQDVFEEDKIILRASNATREARMTSSRSISDAVNSRSMACNLSRDGLMDARLGVVVIAIILSPICLPPPSFCRVLRQWIAVA